MQHEVAQIECAVVMVGFSPIGSADRFLFRILTGEFVRAIKFRQGPLRGGEAQQDTEE